MHSLHEDEIVAISEGGPSLHEAWGEQRKSFIENSDSVKSDLRRLSEKQEQLTRQMSKILEVLETPKIY